MMCVFVFVCVSSARPDLLFLRRSAKSTANVSVSPSVAERCRPRAPTVRPRRLRPDPQPATRPPRRYGIRG